MDRALYVAMSGARETMLAMANNSNNLANVNTPGFQEDLNQFRSMPVFGPGHATRVYAMDERPNINFEKGKIQQTSNPLDVAVRSEGFIAVQARDGTEAYTRRGDLRIDENGFLRNGAGLQVLGQGGPIAVPPREELLIGNDGTLTIKPLGTTPEALAVIDRIKLVKPDPKEMFKGEDGLMRLKSKEQAPPDAGVELLGGYVEGSNVNPVDSLVNMIDYSRRFELQIKTMSEAKTMDESAASIMRAG